MISEREMEKVLNTDPKRVYKINRLDITHKDFVDTATITKLVEEHADEELIAHVPLRRIYGGMCDYTVNGHQQVMATVPMLSESEESVVRKLIKAIKSNTNFV